jgi:glycosyltransferase involved in cell wall biosynthesis
MIAKHAAGRQAPNNPRRILVVTHGYPPLQNNGAELHIQRKVRWWTERGHLVRVAAADAVPAEIMPFESSVQTVDMVDSVEVHRIRFAVADASRPLLDTYRNPLLERFLEDQVTAFEPHLIYQVSGYIFGVTPIEVAARHNIAAALFAVDYWHLCSRITLLRPDGKCCSGPNSPADCATCRLVARRPFQVFGSRANSAAWSLLSSIGDRAYQSTGLDPVHVEDFELRKQAVRRALDYVALVVANSRFLADYICNLGVPSERIVMIRQGLVMDQHPEPAIPHDGFNVLFLGQLTYHKGIDLLIEAVNRLVAEDFDVTLRAFGPVTDGGYAGATSERVQIQGPVSHAEIWRELRNADVLVAPGRWYENSPNVILEAQALGVPVITTDHGGTAEMVRHGFDGLLFRPGDAGSLENALRLLLTDPDLLAHLRSNVTPPHGMDVEMAVEERALDELLCPARLPIS